MKNVVSVIIPCFNNADTIAQTTDSIFNQYLTNTEIIIVDDGSTDESISIINKIIQKNKSRQIKLIVQKNSGPSKARNTGAFQADGKYLLFLDADDLIHADYLKLAVDLMENNNQLQLVYSRAEFFEARTGAWRLNKFSPKGMLLQNCIFISALMRKDSFVRVGGFDEQLNYVEDWELWLRLLYPNCMVHQIDKTLFYYRKRNNQSSLTDKSTLLQNKAVAYVYQKHYELFCEYGYDSARLLEMAKHAEKLHQKYYGVWYRKLFYSIFHAKNRGK